MHTSMTPLPNTIIEQAANWHAHLQSGEVSDSERTAFAQWHAADPAHAEAYARMEALWANFEQVQADPAKKAVQAVLQPTAKRRSKLAVRTLGLAAVLLATGWLSQTQPARVMMADYRTGIGEQRVITLADNSRLTLDTHSAINISFNDGVRHVELLQGKLLVTVAKDKTRPFIVETREGTARALGTQYQVTRHRKVTQVTVLESSVEACASKQSSCVTLHPGDATRIHDARVEPVMVANVQQETAWTHFKLLADDMPLVTLLKELQRYHRGHLYVDEAAISDVHVSGVFALDDTAHTLKVLADTTPVVMTQYTPWLTVIKAVE